MLAYLGLIVVIAIGLLVVVPLLWVGVRTMLDARRGDPDARALVGGGIGSMFWAGVALAALFAAGWLVYTMSGALGLVGT